VNRLKRLEAVELQLRQRRSHADALRESTFSGVMELAAERLNKLSDCSEVRVCDVIMMQQATEDVAGFRSRILSLIASELRHEPLPLAHLGRFYRLLPSVVPV